MRVEQYIVDAFAEEPFRGNPAAVCILEEPLPDDLMQSIAKENNLSETAFVLPCASDGSRESAVCEGSHALRRRLRWFTPRAEIDLCGHATLAAAFVVSHVVESDACDIVFETCSGELPVSVSHGIVTMSMPAYSSRRVPVTALMEEAFGTRPLEAWLARDLICVLPDEQAVRSCCPQASDLERLDGLLQVVTAPASINGFDCVSRCFAPKLGVSEDPVTGSSHCALVPLWAKRLGKLGIKAFQASERSGILACRVQGDRVFISGPAALYAHAQLILPDACGTAHE